MSILTTCLIFHLNSCFCVEAFLFAAEVFRINSKTDTFWPNHHIFFRSFMHCDFVVWILATIIEQNWLRTNWLGSFYSCMLLFSCALVSKTNHRTVIVKIFDILLVLNSLLEYGGDGFVAMNSLCMRLCLLVYND